jgi:far upstream element-binding protein
MSMQQQQRQPLVKELDSPFVVKLPVPNDKVGIIIGKGGMTVKGIQERCRATVQIPVAADEDNPQIRTLSIGADSKEAVDAAQMEIFMALQMQQQQAQQAYNATSNALNIVVPDDKVGIIIGKGGMTVKDIQNRLRVKVQIPQAADVGSNPPVRTLRFFLSFFCFLLKLNFYYYF